MMPKRITLDDPTRLDRIESQKKVISRLNGKNSKGPYPGRFAGIDQDSARSEPAFRSVRTNCTEINSPWRGCEKIKNLPKSVPAGFT